MIFQPQVEWAKYAGLLTNYSRAPLFQSPAHAPPRVRLAKIAPRACTASGSFGQNARRYRAQVGFVWPSVVLFMSKHCFHYGFAGWLRSRKLASFAENVRGDRTPEPSQSPVRRIASITISSPHTPRTKARRSKPHRALITVLKDALLCMSRASFARKICSAVSSCSNAKSQHSATEYLRPEIAVAAAAGSEPRPEERACARLEGRPQARSSERPSFETGACRHAPSSG